MNNNSLEGNADEVMRQEANDSSYQHWESQLQLPLADPRSDVTYEDYILKHDLLRGIYETGFKRPSPIQKETIPIALMGCDILARAETGPEKTAAFCIPALENIDQDNIMLQALVIVPTHKLGHRTSWLCKELGKHLNIQVMVTTSGTKLADDMMRFYQPVHLLVGTPQRILALNKSGYCHLNNCALLVLDEADKLLSPEFGPAVVQLIEEYNMPVDRQILMFSETFPTAVMEFRDAYLRRPYIINLMDGLTFKGITHYYTFIDEEKKFHCLRTLFSKLQINQSVIFVNAVKGVELVAQTIKRLGCSCFYIHRKMAKDEQDRVFQDFRNGACRNLVCGGLLARGIDFESVNLVVNFDIPISPETYLHRVGRSGKLRYRGLAVNLVTYGDISNWLSIQEELKIDVKKLPDFIRQDIYYH